MSFLHSLLGALGLAMFNASAIGQGLPVPTAEYSAERVIESEQGTMTQKIHFSGGRERSETQMGGMQSVMILRPDQQLGWMLMPAQKMYQQMDYAKARERTGPSTGESVEITNEGTETIDGHVTTKYKLVTADRKYGGFMWFTAEGIAIRMDLLSREGAKKSRIQMTLRNLQIADQDDALFELPAGYTRMPSFGGLSLPKFGR